MRSFARLPALAALAALLSPTLAAAQEAPKADRLDEITVTAERTASDLQRVPASVTVVTEDRLRDEAIANLNGIGASVPNLYLNRNFGTSSGALTFLRGVGEGDSIFTNDPPVGIYVDDVLLPRSTGALLDLIDVARIEVLRGPQGTLYGRNTSGGAIRIVTADADPARLGGVVEATAGSYRRADLKGSLNVPLGGGAAVRVSAMTRNQRGWGRNLTNGARVDGQELAAGRAVFGWQTGALTVRATADYSDDTSGPRYPQRFQPDPARAGRYLPVFMEPGGSIDNFPSADTDPLNRTRTGGASLRLEHPLGRFAVTSITGFRFLRSQIGFDQTASPPGQGANVILLQDQHQHSWSQEVTLAGPIAPWLRLLAGAYWFHEHNDQLTAVSAAVPAGTADARYRNDDFFTAPSRAAGNWSPYEPRLDTTSWSGFASLSAVPVERLTVSAGARFTHERKRYAVRFLTAPDTTLVLAGGQAAARTIAQAWDDVSPRVAIDYALDRAERATVYASVSKGFRSGSFDGRARNINFALNRQQAIAPERVWSYEAGLKSEWLDRRVRLNLAYFINDYSNIAFSASRVGTPPEIFRQNVGDARIQGLEAELTARPGAGFELGGTLGTLSDRLTRLASSPGCTAFVPDERDLDLRFTPSRRWSLRGRWERALGGGTFHIGGDYAGSSPYNIGLCNDPQHRVDNFEQVNASVGFVGPGERWRVTAAITNVTDRRFNTGSVGSIGYPADPRQWTLTVGRRF